MHIILVSDRLATAKTIILTGRHIAAAIALTTVLVLALSSLFSYLTVRHAAELNLPLLQDVLKTANADQARERSEFVKENLKAMAVRLGQMQAQLLRIDSMSERVAGLAGVKLQDLQGDKPGKDGRGGPLIAAPLSADDLQRAVDTLAQQLDAKGDTWSMLENQLLDERIRKNLLPTSLPLDSGWNISSFGWRLDPITGESARHEGVDFTADVGTPVKSAAAGVVVNVERHPQYGNLVEIDHGNDLVTRYAHCSQILVQPGTLVKRGQLIAEVGNTGRTTGPHLHFEVRIKGIAQNPNRFLQVAQANGKAAGR